MSNSHLKRLAAPKTWQIMRKETMFVAKPSPGQHPVNMGMSLSTILKETLGYAVDTREVKKILNTNEIKVDGKARKDFRFSVGIFDSLEFPSINEHFRVILNRKGKFELLKIKKEESSTKPCKIVGKTIVRKKVQLNLYDGKNILIDNDPYKVGDTILISLPDQKITKHIKLDKKSTIFLVGGKHIGEIGHVEDISKDKIIYKNKAGELIETSREYAFVVGDSKPAITLE